MSKEKTYGVKWRAGQTTADVVNARERFANKRAWNDAMRWAPPLGTMDAQLEADLRRCMATGIGFEEVSFGSGELYTEGGVFVGYIEPSHDDDGRPIER